MSRLSNRRVTARPVIRREFALEDYKQWFGATGREFRRYLKRHDVLPITTEPAGRTVGVVVVPWVSAPVAWYAVMLAIGLARRGRDVVLLWDDTGFRESHVDHQNTVIRRVLRRVGRHLRVIRLSELAPAEPRAGDDELLDSLTSQNIVWILRGGPVTDERQPLVEKVRTTLAESLPRIRTALDGLDLDYLVVPGGVYGTSGLFRHEAMAAGSRVATFDTDKGIGQICVSGVAAQNGDIARAFDALWAGGPQVRQRAVEVARAEYESRLNNTDSYQFQALPASGGTTADHAEHADHAGIVLMPMNVEWDTAALGRHLHFENSADWITATIPVILEVDDGPVVVRQHPSERRKFQRSSLDMGGLLKERFGDDPRVRFVAAEDPTSSYDLLSSARLVLPYVSTIAIEAAAIGKPVLISGKGYFGELGFVRTASSRDEYLSLLRQGLRGDLEPLPEQAERAWLCYYLTAVCNRIPTKFTPHPQDFWDWRQRDPDSLFADPEVSDILTAIDTDQPVSLLRHRRLTTTPAADAPIDGVPIENAPTRKDRPVHAEPS